MRLLAAMAAVTLVINGTLAVPDVSADVPVAGLSSSPTLAGYPDPATVGFHHAALIYSTTTTSADSVLPLVNRLDTNGSVIPGDSLYDAFLVLDFEVDKIQLDYGATTKAHWEKVLDRWLSDEGSLTYINQAVTRARESALAAGVTERLARRSIIVMMPWMNPAVSSFGEVDGRDRNLAVAADRKAVAQWYSTLTAQRFAAKGFSHLDLWGMYRMREDIAPAERHLVAADASGVHAAGLKYLTIPYYQAPGWDNWREDGFDVSIMQPSYAFRAHPDGGRVDASRLTATAEQAAAAGVGVEIEIRGCVSMPVDQAMAHQYLAKGSETGYQQGVSASFLGEGLAKCNVPASPAPAQRRIYDLLADYVSGQPVASPDIAVTPTVSTTSTESVYQFEVADLYATPGLRIDLDEPTGRWTGLVRAQVRSVSNTWEPTGWAFRATGDQLAGRHGAITIGLPVAGRHSGPQTVRLIFSPDPNSHTAVPPIMRIVQDPAAATMSHSALADGITVIEKPTPPAASYPDATGQLLNDGLVSSSGWQSGRNVGWESSPGQVAVQLDLGVARNVGSVRLDSQGGSDAAVNWPLNPMVLFAETPVVAPEGLGEPIVRQAWGFGPVQVTAKHPSGQSSELPPTPGVSCQTGTEVMCTNHDGYLVASGAPVISRYATVFFSTNAWTMLSEITVLDPKGKPLPFTYRLVRPPGMLNDYVDDGQRLTDQRYVSDFAWRQLSGWTADKEVVLRVELPVPREIKEVSVWGVDVARVGILKPTKMTVEILQGQTWRTLAGPICSERFGTSGVRLKVADKDAQLRQVSVSAIRVTVPAEGGSSQWMMLSEVTAGPVVTPCAPEPVTSGSPVTSGGPVFTGPGTVGTGTPGTPAPPVSSGAAARSDRSTTTASAGTQYRDNLRGPSSLPATGLAAGPVVKTGLSFLAAGIAVIVWRRHHAANAETRSTAPH